MGWLFAAWLVPGQPSWHALGAIPPPGLAACEPPGVSRQDKVWEGKPATQSTSGTLKRLQASNSLRSQDARRVAALCKGLGIRIPKLTLQLGLCSHEGV